MEHWISVQSERIFQAVLLKRCVLIGLGCDIAKSETIFQEIKNLKEHSINTPIVFANRYDGIHLADDSCRILILDSKPCAESLTDRYEEAKRENSDVINIRIAQKIEQGLGRSVRGEKDYSAIIIIGPDLVNFIKSNRSTNFFSKQTKKQIEIGFEIAKLATEEIHYSTNLTETLRDLVNQCLKRDEGWKEFYIEEMNKIGPIEIRRTILDLLKLEREAEKRYQVEDYEGACKVAQKIVDGFSPADLERGWYLQVLARYQYGISKMESIRTQKSALKCNPGLLTPKGGITYEKLNYINANRVSRIKKFIQEFNSYTELILKVEETNSKASFNEDFEQFEEGLKQIGRSLGFLIRRPDNEYKKGPDNLWSCGNNEYVLFECKTEVEEKRKEISKTEASQLNSAIAWFKKEDPDGKLTPLMIIHTKTLSKNGNFLDGVQIIRKQKLENLKNNLKRFFMEFRSYNLHDVSDTNIQQFLDKHKLDIKSIKEEYCENYYHPKI